MRASWPDARDMQSHVERKYEMEFTIEKVDHEDEAMRERLLDFLAPHEVRCLFITGNLKNDFPGSHIYVAARGDEWVGAAGYYETPRSVVPYDRPGAGPHPHRPCAHTPRESYSLLRRRAGG